MLSCDDELKIALGMTNVAVRRLFFLSPEDDLLFFLLLDPLRDLPDWTAFKERFGDKSGLWNSQPVCANAACWLNYATAVNARADELVLGS